MDENTTAQNSQILSAGLFVMQIYRLIQLFFAHIGPNRKVKLK